ncbi:unnamed protein product [Phyllotreta striolata]|uniref:WD repeat-containing protein 74 n=1 Tax=Phyllotreta striolata TaxID=444603 RepID=A0A9N9TP21_PHYSR|nr:unnamed protein product [Phyllotreta striolata]
MEAKLTRYNCFVGTARGFLLSTTDKPNQIKHKKPEFASEVTAQTFNKDQTEIVIGYKNGHLHRYDPSGNEYIQTISDLEGEGGIIGLGYADNNSIIAGKSDGCINIRNEKNYVKSFKINLHPEGTLDAMVVNPSGTTIGTGGEKNDFKLWDIETQKCTFHAKSMGHDNLNLPIPTSIRGITFLPDEPNLGCCCTKEGHVLLYDERIQRRPVVKFIETKASYTTISSAYRERQCLVGTTKGYMQLLDMKAGKCLKTFTSFTGSITSIACDPTEPIVVSVSLDKHLRMHHLETKELLQKVYMKVNLTSLLIRPVIKEEITEGEEQSGNVETNQEIDDEYDNIFNNMEIVSDKIKIKKHHSSEKDDGVNHIKKIKSSTKLKNIFARNL